MLALASPLVTWSSKWSRFLISQLPDGHIPLAWPQDSLALGGVPVLMTPPYLLAWILNNQVSHLDGLEMSSSTRAAGPYVLMCKALTSHMASRNHHKFRAFKQYPFFPIVSLDQESRQSSAGSYTQGLRQVEIQVPVGAVSQQRLT